VEQKELSKTRKPAKSNLCGLFAFELIYAQLFLYISIYEIGNKQQYNTMNLLAFYNCLRHANL